MHVRGGVQMLVTAMVVSLNPSLIARQTTGTDSEEVRPPLQQICRMMPSVSWVEAVTASPACVLADDNCTIIGWLPGSETP